MGGGPAADEAGTFGAPLPFLRVAFVLLLAYGAVLLLPPNPVRFVLGTLSVLAVGYGALALIVGGTLRLRTPEIIAYSVGLSVVVTGLTVLVLFGLGIKAPELGPLVAGLPLVGAALVLNRDAQRRPGSLVRALRAQVAFPDYTRRERAIAWTLLGAIFVALAVLLALVTVPYPNGLSVALAVVGPDGTPASLPTSAIRDQPIQITVSVLGDAQGGAFDLRLRLVPANATGTEPFHSVPWTSSIGVDSFAEATTGLTVGSRGTWQQSLSVAVNDAGDFTLRLDLLLPTGDSVARSLLPLTVTP